MKKIKIMLFILFLMLGIFSLIPLKVSALQTEIDGEPDDWFDYISQFEDGFAVARIEYIEEWGDLYGDTFFAIIIEQSPDNEFNGYHLRYNPYFYTGSSGQFASPLSTVLYIWLEYREEYSFIDIIEMLEQEYNMEIYYNGNIYWNFVTKQWQFEFYGDELNYYKSRVNDLENQVVDLENQIVDLENLIDSLNNEIENLQDEYNRGYHEAIEEINALEEIVPSAFGSIWLVIKDFLSIEILGIAIWEVIGSFVSVALAIIIIRTFLK